MLVSGCGSAASGRCDRPSTLPKPDAVPAGSAWLLGLAAKGETSMLSVVTRRGVFVSRTRGRTWTRIGPGASALAANPRRPRWMIASGLRTIMTTTDAGATWRRARLPACALPVNGAVASPDPRVAYLWGIGAVAADDPWLGGLFRTDDGGATFGRIAQWDPEQLAVHPTDAAVAYAAGSAGLFRTDDAGASWRKLAAGIAREFTGVSIAPGDPDVVYAVAFTEHVVQAVNGEGGPTQELLRSDDGGRTWRRQLELFSISSVAVDPHDADTVYLSGERFTSERGIEVLLRSTDGGARWEERWSTPVAATPTYADSERAPPPLGHDAILLDPLAPGTIYRQSGDRVERSTDRGRTFRVLRVASRRSSGP